MMLLFRLLGLDSPELEEWGVIDFEDPILDRHMPILNDACTHRKLRRRDTFRHGMMEVDWVVMDI